MEYKVKFAQLWTPKYGFCQAGTIDVDSGTVRLSGRRAQGLALMVLFFPSLTTVNRFVGIWYGVQLKLLPLIVIGVVVLLILYYRKKSWFEDSVSVEKELITNVARDRKTISFLLPDPGRVGGSPVKVSVKARNEAEAMSLENELRLQSR